MGTRRPTALAEREIPTAAEPARQALLARPAPASLVPSSGPGDESPLPLDGVTLALSLPIAIALGQLNVPAAAGWAAALIVYKAVSAPGVIRGTLDVIVDGFTVDGDVRARLGVPPREAEEVRRGPGWSTPGAAVRGWRAAVAARRAAVMGAAGEAEAAEVGLPPRGQTGTTTRLPSLASLLDSSAEEAVTTPAEEPLTLGAALARLPTVLPIREIAIDPRPLAVPLGKTPEGEVRWVDLAEDVVNVGVYGTTGAGKDLLLLQWFVLLCRRNRPDTVQFIVLDGKGDWLLPQLKHLAHMRVDPAGGYGNVEAIKTALDTIHQEARERERLIFQGGYRSREHYVAGTGQPLPLLVVIVTDLMTTVQGYVEEELAELISKARALGIRVVMSFQNPTGKDMGWRSNIGLVLAGCMVDGSQDAVVLGIRKLTDMRYRPSQLPNPKKSDPATKGLFVVRHGSTQLLVKTPYLDDDALLALCARLPRRAAPAAEPPLAESASAHHAPPLEDSASAAPAPAPAEDELLAALLRQANPVTEAAVQAERRQRWPPVRPQERPYGRRRGVVGTARPRKGQEQATTEPPEVIAHGSDGANLPPVTATTEGVSEDERLYRMMLVPLTFNQIYKAIGSDRNVLLKRCQRIREERGLGPWPRRRSKLDRNVLLRRLAEVPMGFNEVYRALGGGRTDLSRLWQEVTGQTGTDSLDAVPPAV